MLCVLLIICIAIKEGWDNPNVFTITKLRSSGSENSKLQEIGRGLRLPVDENGNRISNEEFQLNYIVDFNEADFAKKLVDEINGELPETLKIDTDEMDKVAKSRGTDPTSLLLDMLQKKYVDAHMTILTENRNAFFAEYPEFASGVNAGKVTDRNKKKTGTVKIRKAVYSELKELWEAINRKYYLFYEQELEDEIPDVIYDILRASDTFQRMAISSHREDVISESGRMVLHEDTGVTYTVNHPMAYNDFLKRISNQTSIPLILLHEKMCMLSKEKAITEDLINEHSAAQIVSKFRDWKIAT